MLQSIYTPKTRGTKKEKRFKNKFPSHKDKKALIHHGVKKPSKKQRLPSPCKRINERSCASRTNTYRSSLLGLTVAQFPSTCKRTAAAPSHAFKVLKK